MPSTPNFDIIGAITGAPKWLRYGSAALAAALLLWGAWSVWIAIHDRSIVREHEAEQRAVVTERVLESERSANRNDERRRVVREAQIDDLERAREEATTEQPDETSLPAGPAVRAVLECLRAQERGDSCATD